MRTSRVEGIFREQGISFYRDLLPAVGMAFNQLSYHKEREEPVSREDIHDYVDGSSISLVELYREAETLTEDKDYTDDELAEVLVEVLGGDYEG